MILLQKLVLSAAMVIYMLSRLQRCHCDGSEVLPTRCHDYIDLLEMAVLLGSHQLLLTYNARKPAPVEAVTTVTRLLL